MGEAKSNVIELGEKVKITNGQLEALARTGALPTVLNSTKLPVKLSWRLSKLSKALDGASKVYNEARMKVVEKFCLRDDKNKPVIEGQNFKIRPEDSEAFAKEITELLNCEADIDLFMPIVQIDDIPDGVLSANDLVMLSLVVDFRE